MLLKVIREREMIDYEYIELPCFRENTMYVNMEVGKEYNLEELGL